MTALAPTLQAFFTERLIRQRQASPHTLAAYRDTLRLLLVFASARKAANSSGKAMARTISAWWKSRRSTIRVTSST